MRITQNSSAESSLYYIQQGRAKLDKLQELTASDRNINRPSDDPIANRFLLDVGDKLKATDQYQSNISKSTTFLNMTSTALQGMADVMALTKKVVANFNPGTSDTTAQANTVSQLQSLKQQMIDMGNTQLGDQFLFGGAKNATAPFNGNAYNGDGTSVSIEISTGTTQDVNITGDRLLKGANTAPYQYGSVDILQTFDDLIAAVNTNTDAALKPVAKVLEDGATQITNAQSDVAARVIRLDSSQKMIENNKNTLETMFGDTQNVDYAKLAVQINQQKIAFEASLSATAKISQLSLLDYLR